MGKTEMDVDFGPPVRPPGLWGARLVIFLGLLLPLMALSYAAAASGSPGELRERPVLLTTLATVTGPFVGAVARNGQSCCLDFSVRLAAVSGAVLGLGLVGQAVPLPAGRGGRTLRLVLWALGWAAWLLSGQVSLMHAFS